MPQSNSESFPPHPSLFGHPVKWSPCLLASLRPSLRRNIARRTQNQSPHPPRLEIRVSHSFKRRRHFLTATRIAFFAYANFLPGKAPFVRSPKINRKLSQGSCFSFSRSSKPPVMGLKNDPETTAVRRLKGLPSRPPSRQELVTLLCLLNFLYLLCLLVLECCSPESAQHRLRLIGTIRARACFAPGPSAKETFR